MISRHILKSKAKAQIKGNILTFLGIMIVGSLISFISGLLTIGPLLFGGAILLGQTKFILEVVRDKKGQFGTVFSGFNQFGSSFVAFILQFVFFVLWSLLLVIPGIIAIFRYSMTFYILADNPGISGFDAIKKSKEMMVGHKFEFFVLLLSFFWWYVLCAITLGIALIYVAPYANATIANFYEQLKTDSLVKNDSVIENN